ncbi:MAG: hypothetical protein AABY95_04700 [Pseudomonadota bacterium]
MAINSLRGSLYELRLLELAAARAPADLVLRGLGRAADVDPRNPEIWRLSADLSGQPEKAISDARMSLQRGPSRARTWLLLSWRLIRSGRGGDDLDRALRQASQLAPSDRPLQLSLAMMGLQYWAIGSDVAHAVWETAIKHSLRYQPDEIKRAAAGHNLGSALCLGFVERYDMDPWCHQQMTGSRRASR